MYVPVRSVMVSVTRLRGSDDVSLIVRLSDSTRNARLVDCNRCVAHLVTQKSYVLKTTTKNVFVFGSFLYVPFADCSCVLLSPCPGTC